MLKEGQKQLRELIDYLLEKDRWFFYGGVGSLILLVILNYFVSGVWVVESKPYNATNGFVGLVSSFVLLWAAINIAWKKTDINYVVVVFILLGIILNFTLPMLADFPWYVWFMIVGGMVVLAL